MPSSNPYPALPGFVADVVINNVVMPAARYSWNIVASGVESWTKASGLFPDQLEGGKRLKLTAEGIVRSNYNPFIMDGGNVKVNTRVDVQVYEVNSTDLYFNSTGALVKVWNYLGEADGEQYYRVELVGNWKFSDLEGVA